MGGQSPLLPAAWSGLRFANIWPMCDVFDRFPARAKLFLVLVGLIVLGLQLAFYSE